LDKGVRRDTERLDKILSPVCRITGPAVPPLSTIVERCCLGMHRDDSKLGLQFVRQPDVIGIQKSDKATARGTDPEVSGCASASLLFSWVGQVANALRI